jgi:hypothetical protein
MSFSEIDGSAMSLIYIEFLARSNATSLAWTLASFQVRCGKGRSRRRSIQ